MTIQSKSMIMLVILVLLFLASSSVSASSVRISDENFRYGSLIADGVLSGHGEQDVNINLSALGTADVTCINQGGNETPSQNNPKISTSGWVPVSGNDLLQKNGKSPFSVEATHPDELTGEDAVRFGCPNANSTARIEFVYYTDATIEVVDVGSGTILLSQSYTCTTTRIPISVSCTRR